MKGPPALAKVAPQALDEPLAADLWKLSMDLTSASFPGKAGDRRELLAA